MRVRGLSLLGGTSAAPADDKACLAGFGLVGGDPKDEAVLMEADVREFRVVTPCRLGKAKGMGPRVQLVIVTYKMQ